MTTRPFNGIRVVRLALGLRRALPPSALAVAGYLEGSLWYRDFAELVRTYLPQEAEAIFIYALEEDRVSQFCELFSSRYFPLGQVETYEELLAEVPVHLAFSLEDDDYHDPEAFGPGFRLLFAMAEPPTVDDGARVVWLEACLDVVPKEMLQRVPPNGYAADELRSLLQGASFEAAADAIALFLHTTGNPFLDVAESWSPERPPWDEAVVGEMAEDWKNASQTMEGISQLAGWLEEDPPKRFLAFLDTIDQRWRLLHGETAELIPRE